MKTIVKMFALLMLVGCASMGPVTVARPPAPIVVAKWDLGGYKYVLVTADGPYATKCRVDDAGYLRLDIGDTVAVNYE